ncbi:MAG: hypothetical protein ACKO2K_13855 [Alphaproteobacteria bacterium]
MRGADRGRGPLRRAVVLASLAAAGLVAALLAFELVVRAFFPISDFLWDWDPVIGMKLKPGRHGRSVLPGVYDVTVDVNAEGFRDREHALAKPPGRKRVVLLGDSFLEAVQVPFEDSVAAVLERDLVARGLDAEVVSLGVSGAGTVREYLALREFGLRYAPDLVVLLFVENDVSDNSQRLQGATFMPYARLDADGRLLRDGNGRPVFTDFDERRTSSGLRAFLSDRLMSLRFVRTRIEESPRLNDLLYRLGLMADPPRAFTVHDDDEYGFFEIYRPTPRPGWVEAWSMTEQMLLETRDLAASGGSRFAVALLPGHWSIDPAKWDEVCAAVPGMREAGLDLRLPSRRLERFLGDHDVPVVNLFPAFEARATSAPRLYLHGDSHWTPAGHALADDLLAPRVAALLGEGS